VKLTVHDAISGLFMREAYETRYVFVLCMCVYLPFCSA